MPHESLFAQRLKKLNPEQIKAVETINGPVMVIAGPGTGKTEILTLRIANIIQKTDIPPDAILALTFTESAASMMRQRLAEIIGAPAYRVRITTFHGFCNDVIQRYPEYFPRIIGSVGMTDVDQIRIMEQVIEAAEIKDLRPFGDPQFYVRPALRAISELKREGVRPETFEELIKKEEKSFDRVDDLYYESGPHKGKMRGKYQDIKKHISRNKELAILYHAYQSALAKDKRYDYSDMIMEAAAALSERQDLLLTLQEQHQYILVDEHQDTNHAQNSVLESLASYDDLPNLFIVGDEKQAIFRFQGASLENFLYFKKRFPKAELITLTGNYRSGQAILDAAASLMGRGGLSAENVKEKGVITRYIFDSPDKESFFIAANIRDEIAKGEKPEEIAVLYRENRDAQPLARMLEKLRVPFVIESNDDLLRDPVIKKVVRLIEATVRFGEPAALMSALEAGIFSVLPLDFYKLSQAAHSKRVSPADIIRDEQLMKELKFEKPEVFTRAYSFLNSWRKSLSDEPALDLIEKIIRDSGLLSEIINLPRAAESIDRLRAFMNHLAGAVAVRHDSSLADILEYLDRLRDHGILIPFSHSADEASGKVRLMTAHGAKGLEFERVYVTNCTDGHWGNRRRIEHLKLPQSVYRRLEKAESALTDTDNDDERNLFYVALTRAKRNIVLTLSQQDTSGKEFLPTQFLQEIKPELVVEGKSEAYDDEFKSSTKVIFSDTSKNGPDIRDREFLNQLFDSYGLSVTALNNYLECPWRYFYSNLLRIPEAPTPSLSFGRAVHAALKSYYDRWTKGENPESEFLINSFKQSLIREPIGERDIKAAILKGEKALVGYIKNPWTQKNRKLLNEFRVEGVELEGIKLNGIIDRMEILDLANTVNVVDYKTGKPRTRAQISGQTKSSDGGYKRQLVFYGLLLDRFDSGRFKMATGQIDFVEPDANDKYHSEAFEISKDDKKELEEQIREVTNEIRELKFWDKTCGDKDCKYCELRLSSYKK